MSVPGVTSRTTSRRTTAFGPRRFAASGIFELLGDGHAEALADQLLQILVRARHRHAAHRDVFTRVLPALRELNASAAEACTASSKNSCEEIAHAVEEQEIRDITFASRSAPSSAWRSPPPLVRGRALSALVPAMTIAAP